MAQVPNISVKFIKQAETIEQRSERGIATLIIRDDTNEFDVKKYTSADELAKDTALYKSDNYKQINDMLSFKPFAAYVVRIGSEGTLDDALSIVERNIKPCWIGVANGTSADQTALVSWIKDKEAKQIYYRAVCYKATAPDNKQIVNFYNEKVTFVDDRAEKTGDFYVASLIGILASVNVRQSSTNYKCTNLKYVQEVEDSNTAVTEGKFVLVNSDIDEVTVLSGCNSLTTTNDTTLTDDMMYIEIVEAMNMISDDIKLIFKETYLGKKKNNLNNQMLFISGIIAYFNTLAGMEILDADFANTVDIDTEAQRAAWIESGNDEAADWDDDTIKIKTFKRSLFLLANIHILHSMENLALVVQL